LEEDNDIEPIWKQRILLENTPRGNILMSYDPFRFGFSYYADSANIPYVLLNAVAMKYVRYYRCCDLFMDNETPFHSPLIPLYEEKKNEKQQEDTTNKKGSNVIDKDMQNVLAGAPFIKRRKASSTEEIVHKQIKQVSSQKIPQNRILPKEEDFYRNKFIYLGKIQNYPFLKKEDTIKPLIKGNSYETKFKGLFSYSDYKEMFKKDTK
jgi:hypothetical protein